MYINDEHYVALTEKIENVKWQQKRRRRGKEREREREKESEKTSAAAEMSRQEKGVTEKLREKTTPPGQAAS